MLFSHKSRTGLALGLSLAVLHMIFFAVELFSGKFDKKIRAPKYEVRGFINESDISWNDIFSFVPPGIKSCTELFVGEDMDEPFGDVFVHKSIFYRKHLREVYKPDEDRESHVWKYPHEAKVLHYLGLQPHVTTICETGFNAGHGAYLWLRTNPNVTVYSFDLGEHEYSRPMAKIIERHFGKRFNIFWGDSVTTLSKFRREHPDMICDVIFIDGGITYDVVQSDLNNFILMADARSVIVLNNYPPAHPETRMGRLWETAKRAGQITEIFRCDYTPEKNHGFSVGRVEPKVTLVKSPEKEE